MEATGWFEASVRVSQIICSHSQMDMIFRFLYYIVSIETWLREGRTDQRNAQINFSLINLLLFKLPNSLSIPQ